LGRSGPTFTDGPPQGDGCVLKWLGLRVKLWPVTEGQGVSPPPGSAVAVGVRTPSADAVAAVRSTRVAKWWEVK
jgi:hypothetical protein